MSERRDPVVPDRQVSDPHRQIVVMCGDAERGPLVDAALRQAEPRILRRIAAQLEDLVPDAACRRAPRIPRVRSVGGLAGLCRLPPESIDLLIIDHHSQEDSGFDAITYARGIRPSMVIVVTGTAEDADLAVESIRAGASDFLILPRNGDVGSVLPLMLEKSIAHQQLRSENHRLHSDLSRSLIDVALKNRELETMISRLERTARTDELTGLANRRWLNAVLEGNWAESLRHGFPLAFAMLDLDGFKAINDTIGHQRGDEILSLIGRLLRANCREVDLCARYGGDEFCILMPHTRVEEAIEVMKRIRSEFEYMVARQPETERGLGFSAGIAHNGLSHPCNAEELIRHADEAMYAAKESGCNLIRVRTRAGFISTDRTSAAAS